MQGGLSPNLWFIVSELLRQGLMMETGTGAICTICGYASKTPYDVRRHLEGRHSIGNGYHCPLCKIKLKTEGTRRSHVLQVHKKSFSVAQLREIDEKGPQNA